jgi:hypothetical protein
VRVIHRWRAGGFEGISGKPCAMSAEVSGQAEGVTLADVIEDGTIPEPGQLTFPEWLTWRKNIGKRPTKAVDGRSSGMAAENALWRLTMETRHGAEVADQLDEAEELVPDGVGSGVGAKLEEYVAPAAGAAGGGQVTPPPTGGPKNPEAGGARKPPRLREQTRIGELRVGQYRKHSGSPVHALRSQEGYPFELSGSHPAAEFSLGGVW